MSTPILVTSALPYANGSIHLGHLVEYLQTDIFVRFLRLVGEDVVYVCADDTHGTPIMLAAQAAGISPEDFIARWHAEHAADFRDFGVQFDHYSSTHCDENRKHAYRIFESLRAGGHLEKRSVEQTYCPTDAMFLPDRFLRGTCPRCKTPDQYGDSCEACGATYAPADLIEPHCAVCGSSPELRSSEHWFVKLGDFHDFLEEWTGAPEKLQGYVRNYVQRWIQEGLRDWDITRDAPYFGFPVPGEEGLFLYVWMDAPVGYIAATEQLCAATGRDFESYWRKPGARILHFIGKDIIYFHTLFWPAMLHAAGYTLPEAVHVHGFLTVDGRKMSKSRGTLIRARTYLDHLEPTYLRFYFASKLSSAVEDIDLSFEEFGNRVNAELVNKVVNLASRSAQFLSKRLDGGLGPAPADAEALLARVPDLVDRVAAFYREREFSRVVRELVSLAEDANLYLQQAAPWDAIKTDPERARGICSVGVNLTKVLAVLLKPIVPDYAQRVQDLLGLPELRWSDARCDLWAGSVRPFERLLDRLDTAALDAIQQDSLALYEKERAAAEARAAAASFDYEVEPLEPVIDAATFFQGDLRVARVLEASEVEGMRKLLRLKVSLGPLGERNIFAGIRQSFDPKDLVGLQVVCAANLAPRTMSCGVSEGMILATGPSPKELSLVTVPAAARPGDRVH